MWVFACQISFTGLATPTQSNLHSVEMFFLLSWTEENEVTDHKYRNCSLKPNCSTLTENSVFKQHLVIERSWFKKLIFMVALMEWQPLTLCIIYEDKNMILLTVGLLYNPEGFLHRWLDGTAALTWVFWKMPTWPEMKSIEAVRVQVIPDTIATPTLSSTRVRGIALSVGPAHPEVGRLSGYKVVHLVNHQFKIPLFILSWAFSHAQEDVWPHTEGDKRGKWHKDVNTDITIYPRMKILIYYHWSTFCWINNLMSPNNLYICYNLVFSVQSRLSRLPLFDILILEHSYKTLQNREK